MSAHRFLDADIKSGAALLKENRVKNVLFSEGTYQIEVVDGKTIYWPFLQFDDRGKLLDSFCTCPAAEKKKSCKHLGAAYLRVFNQQAVPLHVRFRDSLWTHLCQIASRRHGYDTQILKGEKDKGFTCRSVTGKKLFFVQPLNQEGRKRLTEIILNRAPETEETSLKFSNLSTEELILWREGRPSHHLRYELSFWSDLAKWWMALQDEGEKMKIEFIQEKSTALPQWIEVHFKTVEFGFYIAEVNWPEVIPALATVDSPLPVHEFQDRPIQKIVYDPQERQFSIEAAPETAQKKKALAEIDPKWIHPVGEWLYVKELGFYPAHVDPFLKEKIITQEKIASFLQKHYRTVEKYLEGTKIHAGSLKAHYQLFFDGGGRFHIRCYVFEPGDLQKTDSAAFGAWVFVEGKGFYQLENLLFDGVEKVVPKNKVADFINRHRIWLNGYEDFQTHVSSVESHFTYALSEEGTLRFDTRFDFSEEMGEVLDLDEWIYVKGKGFYSKMSNRPGQLLRPGMSIPASEISRFIFDHREELEQVKGFFSIRCPLEKSGLNIELNESEQIVVRPQFFYFAGYSSEQVRHFGDFLYVAKEGFSEVPADFKLPENYQREKVISSAAEPYFVAYELDNLRNYVMSIDPRLRKPKDLRLGVNRVFRDERSKAGGWLLEMEYETEYGHVAVTDIWQAISGHKRYVFSPAGLISLKQPRFNWLKNISKKKWLKGGAQIRLSTLEWIKLTVFEDLREPLGDDPETIQSRKLLEELRTFHTSEPIELTGLQSHLRTYQELGVRWLWFLYCHGLSGLLCDEMGLGKTHQAMALLAAALNARKNQGNKYLVVCPTSVIYHWEDLLKRFLPKVRVCVFYGAARTLESFQSDYDLLLTSYGTLRSEKKVLSSFPFEIAIFDEIQTAKNNRSQTHKTLRAIDAKVRLGLTGTPIENRLLELKALFDVILPNYLPPEGVFRQVFINPIERNQDQEKKHLLARLIRPFILRRKKAEVLLELPEKTEEIAYCALSDEQKKLYKDVYIAHREALMSELRDEKKPPPLLHIFSVLSALKQVCDHPCLILKNYEEYRRHHSGKWDLFIELLQETRDSGQKLVVFSQYLNMLDIIESYLTENKIGFAGIRGSTRNRKQQLDRFREDPQCEVFVASLQAAGVGVDLVAASVVIHYDRWWNPAKENQATDRVHRIGQSRGVQVFKMVTKGTIEEHIHYLIEKKLTLMEGVISFDEHDQIKSLDRHELLQLLQMINNEVDENL